MPRRPAPRRSPWPARSSCSRSAGARSRSPIPTRSTGPSPATPSSTSCATTSRWPTARCAAPAAGRWRSSASSTAPPGSSSSRSVRPTNGPSGSTRSSLSFPSGRTAEEIVAATMRPRWPGSPTSAASTSTRTRSGPRTSTIPTSCASTSIPVPGVPWADDPRRGARAPRGARGGRPRRLAQDLGLARHPHQRAHRAALDLSRGAARGAGAGPRRRSARARSSPPASGGRRSATASSSTTTRTPRTARWPRPTRSGRCPTRGCRRR